MDGIVISIAGEQKPETIQHFGGVSMGGNAQFRIAFKDHFSYVPESIIRGVQWYLSDTITPEAIPDAIKATEAAIQAKKDEERKAAEARSGRKEALPAEYPYLIPLKPGEYNDPTHAAKNIRAELKHHFPGIKFSVKTDKYSGGNSIGINWTDGPTASEINSLVGKYREGDFNGMDDIYEFNRENVFPAVFGGAKYISGNRHESPELITEAANKFGYTLTPADFDQWGNIKENTIPDAGITQHIYRKARETRGSTPKPASAEEKAARQGKADGAQITENTEKNGIEIRFPGKPAEAILSRLKSESWRWSRFSSCWYNRNTPENMSFALSITNGAETYTTSEKGTAQTMPKQSENLRIAAKFRQMAETLQKQIDAKRDPGISRQNLTARRARIAASMRAEADHMEETQKILLGLAADHESGNVPPILAGITTKAHVENFRLPASYSFDYGTYKSAGLRTIADIEKAKAATRAYITPPDPEVLRKKAIEEKKAELIGAKIPGFFPTPKPVIAQLIEKADIRRGHRVLEPSAGMGDIADAVAAITGKENIGTAEINYTLREFLKLKGYSPEWDFLEMNGEYDRIVMNPPFEKFQDIDHVQHAHKLLKRGGRLVSIMCESSFFRTDKKAEAFREWLDQCGGSSEKLEAGAFTGAEAFRQTGTACRIVVIDN
jgi:hypothetical protein